jgi:hypothetical protein
MGFIWKNTVVIAGCSVNSAVFAGANPWMTPVAPDPAPFGSQQHYAIGIPVSGRRRKRFLSDFVYKK